MAFDEAVVVKDVSLALHPGEIVSILGENGAGKSTLAKVLGGVFPPIAGQVLLRGRPVRFRNPAHALASGVALIHQEPMVFPSLTVAENLFSVRPRRGPAGLISWSKTYREARQVLSGLGIGLDPQARIAQVPLASRQMVELAGALAADAQVLLLDETTASLTPKEVEELFRIIRALRAQGRALAFVSHKLPEVLEISDRIVILRDGRLVATLTPAETNADELVRLMSNRTQVTGLERPGVAEGPVHLRVEDLRLPARPGPPLALEVRRGEIVALAGLVGAGRTEIVQTITGALPGGRCRLQIGARKAQPRNPRQALDLGIVLVPENRQADGLLQPLPLRINIALPILRRLHPFRAIPGKERKLARNWIEQLHIVATGPDQPAAHLSGGNQQKVVLAKCLATQPSALIVDEPTRGVDVASRSQIHAILRELAAQGLAVLMVSSDLEDIMALAHRVLVVRDGAIVAEFEGKEISPVKVLSAATGEVSPNVASTNEAPTFEAGAIPTTSPDAGEPQT
jgi:ABC-type sugar transport system ATPase subunit